ncbi:MAG: glycosyltransferase [Terrimicrobiaceae bacterium]|nr:glycosyltransferase [Terrimicrobiaceae bacterium]
MIRALHVIDHLGLGGAQAVLLGLARAMRAAGVECEVAAIHHGGLFAAKLEEAGIAAHVLSSSKWNPVFLPRFLKVAARFQPDILHFHLQASNWLLKPLAALACPARRVAHDHASADARFRGLATLPLDALAHVFSDRVVAVSPGVAEFLAACEGVPRAKLAVVPNGVDVRHFTPAHEESRLRAREALGLPQRAFVAGALGRLAPEKNFGLLVRLAALCPEAHFILGGEGPCRREIEAALAAASPSARLRLAGCIEDRRQFYHALDVFLVPSIFEGLPMVLLEAMACALPVVSSPLPDIQKALGEAGLFAEPLSSWAWAAALENLMTDSGLRSHLGAAARARCAAHYDLEACARKLVQNYSELSFTAGPA